jgi:magnesium chelatase family protein
VDIVGLSDGAVKESRERVISAIRNSGFEFPTERVLISLSPADLKKEGAGFDLPVALGILNAKDEASCIKEKVLVIGELELSGAVRPVKGVHAAITTAVASGIRYAIVPEANRKEAEACEGIRLACVKNLCEAESALRDLSYYIEENSEMIKKGVEFPKPVGNKKEEIELPRNLVRAIEVAVAGKHSLLVCGCPGSGKTLAIQKLVPSLTPRLTSEESHSVTRIWSLAGLMKPDDGLIRDTPFRMPHQTASIEGICGGGPNCRPGEISLAHNGILFLDEAAEFRSSVLQMLRVPMESHTITLCRAGRSTCYPANFQLIMATNPCPCGNYGAKERICLCSAKSVQQYWNKFSAPLLDRIQIMVHIQDEEETETVNLAELREHIKRAFEIQRSNGAYNSNLNPYELSERAKLDKDALHILDKWLTEHDVGERRGSNILKVALTIANIDGREVVSRRDVLEAISYSKTFELAAY